MCPIDFYGDGPLRDKNGMCVPHEANEKEMMIQDMLIIFSCAVSVMVMVGIIAMAIVLAKLGTEKSKEL